MWMFHVVPYHSLPLGQRHLLFDFLWNNPPTLRALSFVSLLHVDVDLELYIGLYWEYVLTFG